jgi:hypothetical protein
VGPGRDARRAPLALGLLLTVSSLALAGCSPGDGAGTTRDPSARALLDRESGEIVLPLSEYDFYDSESSVALANHATDIAVSKCMNAAGFVFSAASVGDDIASRIGDRTYGIWNEDQARLFGYGTASSKVDAAVEADRAAGGAEWDSAYQECSSTPNADVAAFTPDNDELTDSLVPRLRTEAYNASSSDPAWQTAREAWWKCLRDAGLEPRTGSGDWSSRQGNEILSRPTGDSSGKEEEIRVAYTEAHCNAETGLSQTLGDLEASYQAPLIAANQAALNALKTKNQERTDAVRDYIARNG